MNWIKRLVRKPEPVRVKVEPCPICESYRAMIRNCNEMGFLVLADVNQRQLNSHIASTHYYPKVTK